MIASWGRNQSWRFSVLTFIEVPRTGSTSIRSMSKFLSIINAPRHRSINQMKEIITEDVYNKSFVFACVRNPYGRFASMYGRMLNLLRDDKKPFGLTHRSPEIKNLQNFLKFTKNYEHKDVFFNKQVHFVSEKIDYLMRFESLEQDWKILLNKLRKPYISMNKYHTSPSLNFVAEMSRSHKLADEVYEFFASDFSEFGYSREVPHNFTDSTTRRYKCGIK